MGALEEMNAAKGNPLSCRTPIAGEHHRAKTIAHGATPVRAAKRDGKAGEAVGLVKVLLDGGVRREELAHQHHLQSASKAAQRILSLLSDATFTLPAAVRQQGASALVMSESAKVD